MELTFDNLRFPPQLDEVRPKTEEAVPFKDAREPHCPACTERWEIDEGAQSGVSIAMHCEKPWVVIVCPKCQAWFMITACGKSTSVEDSAIVMHVDQYWIARVRK